MPDSKVFQVFNSETGIMFTLMFFVMFSLANLILIDFMGINEVVTNLNPLIIIILSIILVYLIKNSRIEFSRVKKAFLYVWTAYIISMLFSMAINNYIYVDEVAIWIMISIILLYQFPFRLLVCIIAGALGALPWLLLSEPAVNEFGLNGVLVITAGFILLPKTNRAVLLYILPSVSFLLTVSPSFSAIFLYGVILVVYLGYINLFLKERKKTVKFFSIAVGILVIIMSVFIEPAYHFLIDEHSLLGGGSTYLDPSVAFQEKNIFTGTWVRYGAMTTILLTVITLSSIVIGFIVNKTPVIGIYMLIFILFGIAGYNNYLSLFEYCEPVTIFFSMLAYSLSILSIR